MAQEMERVLDFGLGAGVRRCGLRGLDGGLFSTPALHSGGADGPSVLRIDARRQVPVQFEGVRRRAAFASQRRLLCKPGQLGGARRRRACVLAGSGVGRRCGRKAVHPHLRRGLDDKATGGIANVFDRDSCPGGDHLRTLWGPRVREVGLVEGGLETVSDAKWPAFARRQIQLLVKNGMALETARVYYLMTGLGREALE